MSGSSRSGIGAVGLLLDGFAGYLRDERGVTELTVDVYVADIRRFLVDRGGGDLSELTAAEVSKAVLGQVTRWSPASVRRYGCSLRSFLRYCYLVGLVDRDLSAAALPVSGRRRSLLPKGITPTQAKALLRACDRRRASGRRDYAVIVLILRLGLRASEVATLRLEDLDWRAGQVTVHGKGHRVDQLPLPVDVGEAIAACLCRGRPRTATVREVFVRVRPPHSGLSRSAVTTIVARAAGRARLGAVRAHRLRHTAASDMLRAGASLGEIGQVLRQRSPGSTAAYARVDVERLRTIARPWPTVPFQQADDTGRPVPFRLTAAALRRWRGWLRAIEAELCGRQFGYPQAVAAMVHLLLVDAARNCGPEVPGRPDPLVTRALELVDERFRGPLTLADVAGALHVTPGHLTETVRRRTGRPLGEWILQRRITEARLLLGETETAIGVVAAHCGFHTVGHFGRQFRRLHGMSPSSWRASGTTGA